MGRKRKLNEEQAHLLVQAYFDGEPVEEIAARYGISVPSVYQYTKRNVASRPTRMDRASARKANKDSKDRANDEVNQAHPD